MLGIRSFLSNIIQAQTVLSQQARTTFVLKRRWPPPLHKKHGKTAKLRGRHFVYDLIEDQNVVKQPDMRVILNQYVEGVGNAGDVLTMRPNEAYRDYLLPGLAVYSTAKNMEKYQVDENNISKSEDTFSSPYVQRTLNCLSRLVLRIIMSKTEPWTLEPWHVRTSFRRVGFVVPEHAIKMPPGKVSGPDLSLQEKEFYVTVTVNKTETVNVRCRIHHWATGPERLPWVEDPWKAAAEPLFPEQAGVLQDLPLPK